MADTETVKIESSDEVKKENGKPAELTKLEQDIIRQIEYYFSENNMRRDKFLISKVAETEDGWVDISVLLTFNRLKSITDDAKAIADAMDKATNGTVQLSEDRLKFRRHPDCPLPEFNETRRKELLARTAYAKGFPLDTDLSTLIDFFNGFEKVEQVIKRKYFDREKTKEYLFKGSVFVVFATKEQAEEFVNKPDVTFNEKPLLRYMQSKYFDVKKEEKNEQEKFRKQKKQAKEEAEDASVTLPKAAVVHFGGSDGVEISREEIKAKIAEIDSSIEVAFIHFNRGDKEGDLRFSKENDGQEFIKKLEEGKVRNA